MKYLLILMALNLGCGNTSNEQEIVDEVRCNVGGDKSYTCEEQGVRISYWSSQEERLMLCDPDNETLDQCHAPYGCLVELEDGQLFEGRCL
jgi:hypothetical protein